MAVRVGKYTPQWTGFDPNKFIKDNSLDYIESLSDSWSLYLSKVDGQEVSLDFYKRCVRDIISASEAASSSYPISTTDQYLVRIMPPEAKNWLLEYLRRSIANNNGDVQIALESFLTDCLSA